MSVLSTMRSVGGTILAVEDPTDGVDNNVDAMAENEEETKDDLEGAIVTLESILSTFHTNLKNTNNNLLKLSAEAYRGVVIAYPRLQMESRFFNPFMDIDYAQNPAAFEHSKQLLCNTINTLKSFQ